MPTAVITGASSGIGYAFARRLAVDGYELSLVARNQERLRALRPTLQSAGSPHVQVIQADLTNPSQRQDVVDRLDNRDYPVDLLVNNAGMAIGKDFREATADELNHQLELNVTAVMQLTHAALPGMVERHYGGVINVASIAGMLPGRGSTYSASKAWVISFTEGISMSLAGTGVRMMAVCPGFVHTEFHQRAGINMRGKPESLYVEPDTVVADALEGLRAGRTLVIPGNLYKGVAAGAKLAPRSFVRSVANIVDRDRRD